MPTDAEVIEQIEWYASWLEDRLGPVEMPADGQVPVSSVVVSMPDRTSVRRRWAAVMAAAVSSLLWRRSRCGRAVHHLVTGPFRPPSPRRLPELTQSTLSSPQSTSAPAPVTVPASTVEMVPTSVAATTPDPTVLEADPSLRVSAADPPPLYEPEAVVAIELTDGPDGPGWDVASNTTSIVVVDRAASRAIIIDRDTLAQHNVALTVVPFMVVLGDANVLYGGVQGGQFGNELNLLAIPLSGDAAGTVVASQLIDINRYVEAPPETLGAGPAGVIDRRTGELLMPYIDGDRAPAPPDGSPLQLPTASDDLGTVEIDGAMQWSLQIDRSPDAPNRYVTDSPPAPTQTGGATIWTWIGPQLETEPVDYGTPTMPVVATLHPDGTATWMRLPEDWSVVDSTIAGTVLGRLAGTRAELAIVAPPANAGLDLVAADFEPTADLASVRVAVDRNQQPRASTEQLITAMIQAIEAQMDSCDVPRLISRLDPLTVRVKFGCDDATGGVDYRLIDIEGAGSFDVPIIERRQLCIRGTDNELCI